MFYSVDVTFPPPCGARGPGPSCTRLTRGISVTAFAPHQHGALTPPARRRGEAKKTRCRGPQDRAWRGGRRPTRSPSVAPARSFKH